MSFHLLHVREHGRGELVRLGNMRLATGLGRKTMQTGFLEPAAFQHGLHDLGVLHQELRSLAPDRICVVATSAIRAASNSHAFIAAARELYGFDIEILSAEEEAQLSYEGAASELGAWKGSLAVADLGGGSCELAVGEGKRYRTSLSADIGVLPLREAFAIDDAVGPIKAGAVAEVVRMAMRPAKSMLGGLQAERLVFASGNARAVYRLAQSVLPDSPPPGQMTLWQMRSLRDYVVGRLPAQLLEHDVDANRAEVIAIAVIVLEAIMSSLGCLVAEFSNRGLREGVVLRELARPSVADRSAGSYQTLASSADVRATLLV